MPQGDNLVDLRCHYAKRRLHQNCTGDFGCRQPLQRAGREGGSSARTRFKSI
ncbi:MULTISPECIES: hypothetical protein [Nostocales]|uniref:Uncharacterized protein n=2 Tax=Nostocales TaxID=1161 RepID=A0ABW8WX70_9CYAN|nr:hypothetical protein [Tolypothrix bouteillei]